MLASGYVFVCVGVANIWDMLVANIKIWIRRQFSIHFQCRSHFRLSSPAVCTKKPLSSDSLYNSPKKVPKNAIHPPKSLSHWGTYFLTLLVCVGPTRTTTLGDQTFWCRRLEIFTPPYFYGTHGLRRRKWGTLNPCRISRVPAPLRKLSCFFVLDKKADSLRPVECLASSSPERISASISPYILQV